MSLKKPLNRPRMILSESHADHGEPSHFHVLCAADPRNQGKGAEAEGSCSVAIV